MGIARYKDLCIDADDSATLGRFYAAALGLRYEALPDGDARLVGDDPAQAVWVNTVPEPKSVKHRVHLDINAASADEVAALGAVMVEPAEELDRPWSVMRDPEGGELCVFERPADRLSSYRLHELVVDCADPRALAQWWAEVFGCRLDGREDKGWWWIQDVPGCPFGDWDFVPVPEPKAAKNRVHWDVTVDRVADLTDAGATVLQEPGDGRYWTVLADPEGNEFCAFLPD
jgi:catechol 2,3-dioxygenase-like lactoylglutathione lyase family enzyme